MRRFVFHWLVIMLLLLNGCAPDTNAADEHAETEGM